MSHVHLSTKVYRCLKFHPGIASLILPGEISWLMSLPKVEKLIHCLEKELNHVNCLFVNVIIERINTTVMM